MRAKNNQWVECFVTGIHEDGRSYEIEFEDTGSSFEGTTHI